MRDLALQGLGRIEPMPPAVEAQSPNHWTTREAPAFALIIPSAWIASLHLCGLKCFCSSWLDSDVIPTWRPLFSQLEVIFVALCVSVLISSPAGPGPWQHTSLDVGMRVFPSWSTRLVFLRGEQAKPPVSSMWSLWAAPLYPLESGWMVLWALQALLKSVLAPKHKKKTANMKLIIGSKK